MRRPSPAFVLACIALFVSLGGTGYAAGRLGAEAAAPKKARPVTASQVNKLIAAYVKAHHIGATGPQGLQGPQGSAGAAGGPGPAGPGPQPISASLVGEHAIGTVATVGPWTVGFGCGEKGKIAELKINGPGTLTAGIQIEAFGASEGKTYSVHGGFGGTGTTVNGVSITHGYMVNEATVEQYDLAIYQQGTECSIVGSAIPIH